MDLAQDPSVLERIDVEVAIAKRDDGRFSLDLAIQRANDLPATRQLSATQCDTLTDAALWLVALVLNQPSDVAAVAAQPPDPSAGAPDQDPARPPYGADELAIRKPPARKPWSYRVRLGALTGMLWQGFSGPQALAGLRGGIAVQRSYTELRLQHAVARTLRLPAGGSAAFDSQTLALVQCLEFDLVVRLLPCLGAELDRTHGRTGGLLATRDTASYWLAGSGRVQAFLRFGAHFELSVDAALRLPVTDRPRFVVGGVGAVGEVRFVSVAIALGLGGHF